LRNCTTVKYLVGEEDNKTLRAAPPRQEIEWLDLFRVGLSRIDRFETLHQRGYRQQLKQQHAHPRRNNYLYGPKGRNGTPPQSLHRPSDITN
jgi:hypothetical protein